MKLYEQEILLEKMIKYERELFATKGKEYAGDDDVLSNFKDSDVVGLNSKQKLWVYLSKHISSIASYIKNGQEFSSETIESRIADARCYLALLYMLIHEEKNPEVIRICKCQTNNQ